MHWVNPPYMAVTNFIATGICDACAFGTAAAEAEAEAEAVQMQKWKQSIYVQEHK